MKPSWNHLHRHVGYDKVILVPLSSMLQSEENNGMLIGVKVCREAPQISHLLFADDSLVLMEASANNARVMNSILESYEACSGQVINKEKSAILFSKNTNPGQKEEVRNSLQISSEGFKGKYLGLPAYIGKAKS